MVTFPSMEVRTHNRGTDWSMFSTSKNAHTSLISTVIVSVGASTGAKVGEGKLDSFPESNLYKTKVVLI